jgi:hypothetical protein
MVVQEPKVYPGDRKGGPCGGWSTARCQNLGTERVVIDGCKFCGGGDCGDTPDSTWMCSSCAAEARADGVTIEDDGD